MNKLVAKGIVILLITVPIGLLISYKFGETANWIYWGGMVLGQFIQQIVWNFWE